MHIVGKSALNKTKKAVVVITLVIVIASTTSDSELLAWYSRSGK